MILSKLFRSILSLFIFVCIQADTIVLLSKIEKPITIYSHGSLCNKWTSLLFHRTIHMTLKLKCE